MDRDHRLDVARGIAILLVVAGHALEPLLFPLPYSERDPLLVQVWLAIYSFHMPAFFLLAGAVNGLRGREPIRTVVLDSARLILCTLIIHLVAAVLLWPLRPRPIEFAATSLLCGEGFSLAPLWFLVALALVRVLEAIAAACPHGGLRWAFLGLVLAGSYAGAVSGTVWWQNRALLGALPFYLAGRLSHPSSLVPGWPAALAGLLTVLWLSPGNTVHLASGQYGDVAVFFATATGGTCLLLAVSAWVCNQTSGPVLPWLGRHSFHLFMVNAVVLAITPSLNGGAAVLWAMIGIPAQVALAWALRRPLSGLHRWVTGGVPRPVQGVTDVASQAKGNAWTRWSR